MKTYIIDNCKRDILGRSCLEWLKRGISDASVIESLKEIIYDYDYTCLLYTDTPLIDKNTLEVGKERIEREGIIGVKIGNGYLVKGMTKLDCSINREIMVTKIDSLATYNVVKKIVNNRILEKLEREGIEIFGGEYLEIDDTVEVKHGTKIYPFNRISGDTIIAEDSILYSYNDLHNCRIGRGTDIRSSFLTDCIIGENTTVGPFACIRRDSTIGNNCRIGDFVEVKKATLADGVKCAHLSYIGDACVGEKTNIGCGTVFANYNGKIKQKTIVGKGVFIGCNSNLVAPLFIGDKAYIAAGSTVTDTVPPETLCIARSRQVIKKYPKLAEE